MLFSLVLLSLSGAYQTATALNTHYIGCFSDHGDLVEQRRSIYMSTGLCINTCVSGAGAGAGGGAGGREGFYAMTNSTHCLCGSEGPPIDSQVDEEKCNIRCPGYPRNMCGSRDYLSVGVFVEEPRPEEPETSSASVSSASDSHWRTAQEVILRPRPTVSGGPSLGAGGTIYNIPTAAAATEAAEVAELKK